MAERLDYTLPPALPILYMKAQPIVRQVFLLDHQHKIQSHGVLTGDVPPKTRKNCLSK